MTKFIAISNRRGGVGKTTGTMMLTYGFAVLGFQRVLVIDLDAQSSTSITMMGHERWRHAIDNGRTIGDLLLEIYGDDKAGFEKYIAHFAGDVHIIPGNRKPDIDIIPSSFELDHLEREIMLMGAGSSPTIDQVFTKLQTRVAEILRSFVGRYDIVLMDCPPGLSNIAWGAIKAADYVLVPYIPDMTAEDNVGWFLSRLSQLDGSRVVRVLPNRVMLNSPAHAGIMDAVHNLYQPLGPVMPARAALASALEFRASSQAIRTKFGTAMPVIENLFRAMLTLFETTQGGRPR